MTQNYCRICHQNNNLEKFCKCSGTCGFMHKECLEKWLNHKKIFYCEICKYKYNIDFSKINYYMILFNLIKKYIIYLIIYYYIFYFFVNKLLYSFNYFEFFFFPSYKFYYI